MGKLGQDRTRQQIRKIGRKGRKNKKREKKFEWLVRRRRRNQGLEFAEGFQRIKNHKTYYKVWGKNEEKRNLTHK